MSKKIWIKKHKKERAKVVVGTLSKKKKGFGFVMPEDGKGGDVFISKQHLNGAMDGDIVEVKIFPEISTEGSKEGFVQKVLKRSTEEVVGTFEHSKKFGFVIPDDRRIDENIFIRKKDFKGAQKGDRVVAKIIKYPDAENSAEGRITEIVSRAGEPGGDIKALIRQYNLIEAFPNKVNAEAESMATMSGPDPGSETIADICGRRDLRHMPIITIDGADAKDLDDAVSIKKLSNGNYLLGVHIADVSHYVLEDGLLDKEALKRGNSVYLIDRVIPMLPKVLSNGICSLNPDADRMTLSVDMEITPAGSIVRHEIYESVIRSQARMVYTDVSDMIEKKSVDLIEKYDNIYNEILLMTELSEILERRRADRGSLDFEFDEAFIRLDERGIAASVEVAERRVANKLIESFMLAANETVAEHFFHLGLPFVYRVHEKPSWEKMEEFQTFIKNFGLVIKGNMENIRPKALDELLAQVKGEPYESVVNTVMLRSMKKAFYDTQCGGHFGLGLKYYCHFTSPIRRYPDLIIHRIIKESLRGNMDGRRIRALRRKVEKAAETASLTERQGLELERDVEKMKKAEFMWSHIGEQYEGVISGVTNYGFYVELPNTVEGMVRVDYLHDDFYDYEPSKYRLVGRNTRKIYALGDKVMVGVQSVSIEERHIDFSIVEKQR